MAATRPRVVVTRKLPAPVETRMRELFDVRLNETDHPFSRAQLTEAVREADVLVPTVTDRVDSVLLAEAGPNLRLIANFGAGVDHIDLATCRDRGITVTNTPDVLTEDTADLTLALILAVARRVGEGERLVRAGKWPGWAPIFHLGTRLRGKRFGIVGMGRIGQAVARRASGFGLLVHYHNRRRLPVELETELGVTYWENLDAMLAGTDIVSLHCPLTPATYHLMSAHRLSLLPRRAIVVNTARGEVIDEAAMIRMLQKGELGGAGLDVYTDEPAVNPKLLALNNVVLLPHLGSATLEGRVDMGEKVLVNIKLFVDGHTPPDRVLGAQL